MSGVRKPPFARDRMLGMQLRAARVRQAWSLEKAAELAQVSLATMSRIENGKRHITSEDAAMFSTLYGLPVAQRADLIEIARSRDQVAWWHPSRPAPRSRHGELSWFEATAHTMTEWSISVVPELLQTELYAASYMRALGFSSAEIARRWPEQAQRQHVLRAADYTAFISEFALRTAFGSPDVLRQQLAHLIAAPDRGIGVRLVRAGCQVAAMSHPWLLLEFSGEPPMVYVDLQRGGLFLHQPAVHAYSALHSELKAAACSVAESRSLFEQLAGRL